MRDEDDVYLSFSPSRFYISANKYQFNSSQIDSEQKQKIIYLRLVEKWRISSIATKTRVDQDQINEILSDFIDNLKLVKTQEQADRLQQKTNRVRNDEEEIKKWVQTLQDLKYTISQIRNSINKNKEAKHKVSYYRIRKTLKNTMGLTYKKATIVNRVMKQADRKKRFFEAAKIQMYLEKNNKEIIFIDEAWASKPYSWSKRGNKAYIYSLNENASFSIWFAFSAIKFYGAIITTGTFDGKKFIVFLKQLIYQVALSKERSLLDLVLVADNA